MKRSMSMDPKKLTCPRLKRRATRDAFTTFQDATAPVTRIAPFTGNDIDSLDRYIFTAKPAVSEQRASWIMHQSRQSMMSISDETTMQSSMRTNSMQSFDDTTVPTPNAHTTIENGSKQSINRLEDYKLQAVALERERRGGSYNNSITIHFPDPPLSIDTVSAYSKYITNVHFPSSISPRVCFVSLRKGTDVAKVIADISKIPFGNGHLAAELRQSRNTRDDIATAENIDPCTLYLGNMPYNVTTMKIKQLFPRVQRVELSIARHMRATRFAFLYFKSASDAIQAYCNSENACIDKRRLIIRFRRMKRSMPDTHVVVRKKSIQPQASSRETEQESERECITESKEILVNRSVSCEELSSKSSNGNEDTTPLQTQCKCNNNNREDTIIDLKKRVAQLEELVRKQITGSGIINKMEPLTTQDDAGNICNNTTPEVATHSNSMEDVYMCSDAAPATAVNATQQPRHDHAKNSSGEDNSRDSWNWRRIFGGSHRKRNALALARPTLNMSRQITPNVHGNRLIGIGTGTGTGNERKFTRGSYVQNHATNLNRIGGNYNGHDSDSIESEESVA